MDRKEFHTKLVSLMKSPHVYFQPPENVKIEYPCIVYNLDNLDQIRADNSTYLLSDSYSVTYITRDPDDELIRLFPIEFKMCRFDRRFVSDNLYHYIYTIYT